MGLVVHGAVAEGDVDCVGGTLGGVLVDGRRHRCESRT